MEPGFLLSIKEHTHLGLMYTLALMCFSMQVNPTPDVKIWAGCASVFKMSQAISKPVVAQQPQLLTEVAPQGTPHSCSCTSVSSQQGG